MKTIALVAEKGAGKGLFVDIVKKLLPDFRIVSVRFSDALCDILDILGKEKSRHNIDTLVTALRAGFHDEGILNGAMQKRLGGLDADIVLLDGLRKTDEVLFVRERSGVLVYVIADQKIRYERRKQTAEKPDEMNMSWEQFVDQDGAAPHREIRQIGETMADVTIENNGTLEEFELKVKKIVAEHHLAEK